MSVKILVFLAATIAFLPPTAAFFRKVEGKSENDETFLEMMKRYNFPVYHKYLETKDGYIQNLFRIPGPQGETLDEAVNKQRQPVLFLHGVVGSADSFILNGPDLGIATALANTGKYDCWLYNARGNKYSRLHSEVNPDSDRDFWMFSFEEYADYDLEVAATYVLLKTGQPSLDLVGYSQGTTTGFYALATNKEFWRDKISRFIAIAPVITLNYTKEKFLVNMAKNKDFQFFMEWMDYLEVFPAKGSTTAGLSTVIEWLCWASTGDCVTALQALVSVNTTLVNEDRVEVYMNHFQSGSSIKNLEHMAQIIRSGKFQRYDYGVTKNRDYYDAETPPEVDISQIEIPTAMIVGRYDTLATVEDNRIAREKIKSLYFYDEYEYDHLAFSLGKDMSYLQDVEMLLDKKL